MEGHGPLADNAESDRGVGRVWRPQLSLGISPPIGLWTYSAGDPLSFYLRFSLYSVILMLWLPPIYSLYYDLVLPRMRGITSLIYIIISTLLGLGMGPYFVGIVADRNGGDLGKAIMSVNVVAPVVLACLFTVLWRIGKDEITILIRARAGGEKV